MIAHCLAHGTTPVDVAIAGCEARLAAAAWHDEVPYTVLGALAFLHAQAGRIPEAREYSAREISEIRQGDTLSYLATATAMAGIAERVGGNHHEAAIHLRSAYAMLELEGDRAFRPEVAGELACILALSDELDEARRLAQEATTTVLPHDFRTEVLGLRAFALVYAGEGDFQEARKLSDEALVRTARSDWLTFHGETLQEAARIRRLAGGETGAEDAWREALAVYEKKANAVGAQYVREHLDQAA